MVREKKDYIKIWELDSNNRDVDRDSDESGIDKSLDSLRPIERKYKYDVQSVCNEDFCF